MPVFVVTGINSSKVMESVELGLSPREHITNDVMMAPELTSPTYLEELPDLSGSGRDTSLSELIADVGKNFLSRVHGRSVQ